MERRQEEKEEKGEEEEEEEAGVVAKGAASRRVGCIKVAAAVIRARTMTTIPFVR